MAQNTVNMALTKWDLGNDQFSYPDLAANWDKVDAHDHTSGKGLQIPAAGVADGAITASKLATNAVTATAITNSTITDAKLAAATVTDTKLASPNNGVYRTILFSNHSIANPSSGTTWPLSVNAGVFPNGGAPYTPAMIGFRSSDYAVAGKTVKLNIAVQAAVNLAGMASTTFTWGLYTLTYVASAAVSGTVDYALGTLVSGSTVAIVNPAAGMQAPAYGTDFTAPTGPGAYVLGVAVTGATPGATAAIHAAVQLRVRAT